MAVIGFIDLCMKLDPKYEWLKTMLERETRPAELVGFTIAEYDDAGWFVTFGDCPVAMLSNKGEFWTVSKYVYATTGPNWLADMDRRSVAAALDMLLDIMVEFRARRSIEISRGALQRATNQLKDMASKRQRQ